MSAARAAYAVWRRELQVTLRAPIVYVIGGLQAPHQEMAWECGAHGIAMLRGAW